MRSSECPFPFLPTHEKQIIEMSTPVLPIQGTEFFLGDGADTFEVNINWLDLQRSFAGLQLLVDECGPNNDHEVAVADRTGPTPQHVFMDAALKDAPSCSFYVRSLAHTVESELLNVAEDMVAVTEDMAYFQRLDDVDCTAVT